MPALVLAAAVACGVVAPGPAAAERTAAQEAGCKLHRGTCQCETPGSELGCGLRLDDPGREGQPPAPPGGEASRPPATVFRTEDLYPACTEARRTAPDACAALECTADDGTEGWFFLIEQIEVATGRSLGQEVVCLSVEPGGGAVIPDPPSTEQVLESTPIRAPVIGRNPSGRGLTGLESWFWAEGAAQVGLDVSLNGWTVAGSLRAVEWRWHVGPGGPVHTSAGPGSAADPAFRHTFERKGTVEVTVEVVWSGSYTVSGFGTTYEVPGLATTTSSSVDYTVAEVRSVLDAPSEGSAR